MENNKCMDCGKCFDNKKSLQRHQVIHKNKNSKRYTCPVCSKSFSQNYNLSRHLNLHTQEQKYVCDICYRAFNDSWSVKKHRLSHFPPSKYTCEYCQQKFNRRGNLKVHLVSMHLRNLADKEVTSTSVDSSVDNKLMPVVSVKSEQVSFTGVDTEHAPVIKVEHRLGVDVDKKHVPVTGLENVVTATSEQMTGENSKKYVTNCLHIDNEIGREVKVKVELEEVGDEEAPFVQTEKSMTHSVEPFITSDNSTEGEIKVRLVNGKSFNEEVSCWQCGQCGKVLSCKSHLETHMERHTDTRKYQCDHCTKTFKTRDDLQRHQKTYLNPLRLECEYCGKIFNKNTNLKRHLRLHTGEKPYHCFTCNQSFSDPTNFKNHKWKHSDEKPWFCEKCNKNYATKKSLEVHVCINQHGDDLTTCYQCNICKKEFSSSKSLRTHKSAHTREITRKAFECHLCAEKFKWQTRYESHLISHVREEEERKTQRAKLEQGMAELANRAKQEEETRKARMIALVSHANAEEADIIDLVSCSKEEETKKTKTGASETGVMSNEMCCLDKVQKVESLESEMQVDETNGKANDRYESHLIKCIIAEEERKLGETEIV